MNPQISTALTSGLRQLSETPASFPAPSIEYGLLSPLLIVFGVAVVGVFVEAFAPRPRRYLIQSVLAMLGLDEAEGAELREVAAAAAGRIGAGQIQSSRAGPANPDLNIAVRVLPADFEAGRLEGGRVELEQ